MREFYEPGEGFAAGINEALVGPQSKDCTFLQTIPQKTRPEFATEIEFYSHKGQISVASESGYGSTATLIDNDRFQRTVYTYPLFKEAFRITGSDLLKRPGHMGPHDSLTPEEAQAYWTARRVSALYTRVQMAREAMMADMILNARLTFKKTTTVNLKRKAELSKTVATKWTAGKSHDAIKDIAEMCLMVDQESGIRPKAILMDSTTYELMRASATFEAYANFTNTDIRSDIAPLIDRGAALGAMIVAGGYALDVWIYNKQYEDAGKRSQFIPKGKVIIGDFTPNNQNISWYFGATDALVTHRDFVRNLGIDMDEAMADINDGEVIPTAYAGPDYLEVGLQSAFVCLPRDINMFGVLTVD